MAKLELRGISHNYKDKSVLKDINFTLENGVTALLGPNGAGKSTMIKIITGLLPPTQGSILFNDVDIVKLGNRYYDYLGYLPQMPQFYNNFTGLNFLRYISILKGIPKGTAHKKIAELLYLVNLEDDKDRKIGTYSGGMKQRLGIAEAMLNDPQVLVLDEPTAGLDPNERIRFRNIISHISHNRIVLLATHIVSDVECIAKNMLLLKECEVMMSNDIKLIIDEIDMKVFQLNVGTEIEVSSLLDTYLVSNIKENVEGGFNLRILTGEESISGAVKIEPNLEDIFLYYFNKEKRGR